MSGRDLLATASTGSGKTAAFLLPLLNRLHGEDARGLSAMILAPTRELAAQIGREFSLLARNTQLRAAVVVGGEPMKRQIEELRRAQVVIACPGRLIDHLEHGSVRLDRLRFVVLDEADRMLDMGFLPQLRRIMRVVTSPHQTLMFSATMDASVAEVAREFLRDPSRVSIGRTSLPPSTIRQVVYPATPENKNPMLLRLLKRPEVDRTIVFTRTKHRADRVARLLVRNGIKAVAIHGDRSQNQRSAALAGLRRGQFAVLVATDVAARGLDIPDVSHVINFDLPETPDSYVHRIGRTARMGKTGEALSMVMQDDVVSLRAIEKSLGRRLERARIEGFDAPDLKCVEPSTDEKPAPQRHRQTPRGRHAAQPSGRRGTTWIGER